MSKLIPKWAQMCYHPIWCYLLHDFQCKCCADGKIWPLESFVVQSIGQSSLCICMHNFCPKRCQHRSARWSTENESSTYTWQFIPHWQKINTAAHWNEWATIAPFVFCKSPQKALFAQIVDIFSECRVGIVQVGDQTGRTEPRPHPFVFSMKSKERHHSHLATLIANITNSRPISFSLKKRNAIILLFSLQLFHIWPLCSFPSFTISANARPFGSVCEMTFLSRCHCRHCLHFIREFSRISVVEKFNRLMNAKLSSEKCSNLFISCAKA